MTYGYQFKEEALTANDLNQIVKALDRSIRKWGELSNSTKCNDSCKAYNLSQAQQLAEIKKLIKSLPIVEGEEHSPTEIGDDFSALLG